MNEPTLESERLSDGSTVHNVHIPEQTIYCIDQKHAEWLIGELKGVTSIADGRYRPITTHARPGIESERRVR